MPTIEQGQTTDATPLTLHSVTLGRRSGIDPKVYPLVGVSSGCVRCW